MPEALNYVFEEKNKKAFKELEAVYKDEYEKRRKEFKRRWAYYDGDHDLPLKQQQDGYNDNVIVNHVEALAERLTAFLLGDGIRFDVGGDEQEAPEDEAIKQLWTTNRGDLLQENLAVSGAIEGHNCVRIMPQEGDLPKLVHIKQAHFAAFWDPFDMSNVLWYRLQHIAGSQGKRIDYVKGAIDLESGEVDHTQDGWSEAAYVMAKKPVMGSGDAIWKLQTITPWDYPWPPLVDWQNLPDPNNYYGKDDVKGAIRLNDALNFILSNTQRIIKHHASPKTVGIGFSASQIVPTEVGGLFTVDKPSSEATVFNLELQSDGALVQWLAGIIASGLWESGGMVDPANIKDAVGQLTNFGLRVLFVNAIQRTSKKRLLYGEAFEAINQHCLELMGQPAPDSVVTVWPDVLPEDEATVNTLMTELDKGIISKQTYRKLRGYDNADEEDRISQERGQSDVGANILSLIANNRPFNGGQQGGTLATPAGNVGNANP